MSMRNGVRWWADVWEHRQPRLGRDKTLLAVKMAASGSIWVCEDTTQRDVTVQLLRVSATEGQR